MKLLLTITITLLSISFLTFGKELKNKKDHDNHDDSSCTWTGWSSWSECENGKQTRIKTCECDSNPYDYRRGLRSGQGNPRRPGRDGYQHGGDDESSRYGHHEDDGHSYDDSNGDYDYDSQDNQYDYRDHAYDRHYQDEDDNDYQDDVDFPGYEEDDDIYEDDDFDLYEDDDIDIYQDDVEYEDDDDGDYVQYNYYGPRCGEQKVETRDCCTCEWSEWSEWSQCSNSCGGGKRTRTRECLCGGYTNDYEKRNYDHLYGNHNNDDEEENDDHMHMEYEQPVTCQGDYFETESCNEDIPCCNWGGFSEWSECSDYCGGYRRRYAQCECTPQETSYNSLEYTPDPIEQCEGYQPYEEEACDPCYPPQAPEPIYVPPETPEPQVYLPPEPKNPEPSPIPPPNNPSPNPTPGPKGPQPAPYHPPSPSPVPEPKVPQPNPTPGPKGPQPNPTPVPKGPQPNPTPVPKGPQPAPYHPPNNPQPVYSSSSGQAHSLTEVDDLDMKKDNNINGTLTDDSLVDSNTNTSAQPPLVLVLVPTLAGIAILVLVGTIILVKIKKPSEATIGLYTWGLERF